MTTLSYRIRNPATALQDALAFLGAKPQRKLGHNTYMRREGDYVAIRYHSTDIVTVSDKGITLDSGGYRTSTTKERFNSLLPVRVWQTDGQWFVAEARPYYAGAEYRAAAVYADGMHILPDGSMTGTGSEDEGKALRKRIHKYAEGFARAAVEGKVPAPGNGDCWYCAMHVTEGPHKGESLGDATGDDASSGGHLDSHMKEGYFVASMLANAAREWPRGRWLMTYGLPVLWDPTLAPEKRAEYLARDGKSLARDIKKALRRYLGKRLGLALR